MTLISRRTFAQLSTAAAAAGAAPILTGLSAAPEAADDKLQSELLLDLVLEPKRR